MTHGLSKSRLQAFRQCPKRLWLTVHRPDGQDVSAETEQRFQIGFQVGDVARSLRPDGILIDTPDAASGAWREIYYSDTAAERRIELRGRWPNTASGIRWRWCGWRRFWQAGTDGGAI